MLFRSSEGDGEGDGLLFFMYTRSLMALLVRHFGNLCVFILESWDQVTHIRDICYEWMTHLAWLKLQGINGNGFVS